MKARSNRGVTLIELMIAVVVVSVLAAIAYPNYRAQVVRTRRAAAAGCTLELAQFMEHVYATNLRYDLNNGAATVLPNTQCRTDLSGVYVLSFAADPDQRTFSVQAVPQGKQATDDTKCGTLSINQANLKMKSGSGTVAECWR